MAALAAVLPLLAVLDLEALQTDSCPSSAPSTPPLDPGYTATAGYNRLTGLGEPFARSSIKAIVGV